MSKVSEIPNCLLPDHISNYYITREQIDGCQRRAGWGRWAKGVVKRYKFIINQS